MLQSISKHQFKLHVISVNSMLKMLNFKYFLKCELFQENRNEIIGKGFKIISKDFERPWGGFLVIDESQAQDFANTFFDGIDIEALKLEENLVQKF